ncbi:DVU_1553 family AMP-dependent CoA ligase [Maledivibacter halophilus]|uniref:Phenylacetate-coenzyme A ligase PaaK, adenylate-forming domain family n=1 Tax=Maledivibacter halophilus TaxID=36842 RepID=A0A1T5J601_9FIRM|nr:AMP-binding protein [Maledivibacter halophilus]SKC46688.1 Phenylacetate-coenzyme A ligase PaaK, adenylate-forming domain family [Maledivibacter halophilus]
MKITPLDRWIKEKIGYKGKKDFKSELDNYILNKLHQNIKYVKENSIFYKNHLKNTNKISSFKDFEKIPFTTDLDIRKNPGHFLCVSPSHISRIVTLRTSGTTGENKRIFFTKEDQELTIDFFKIGMSTLVEEKDKVLILLPGEREGSVGDLLGKALKRLGVKVYIYGPVHNSEKVLEIIKNRKINSLVGIPIQILSLSRYKKSKEEIKLKSILLSTDYASNTVIKEIEKTFNCKVFDHYGMTEMGLGGGVECEALKGYHLREADLYFEIIDPITKEKLPNGKWGEVVFTTLTRKGMPLIRYKTGDISRIINTPCLCGTYLRRLDKIIFRKKEGVLLGDIEILTIGELDDILFSINELMDFKAVVTKEEEKDCLTIYIDTKLTRYKELLVHIYNRLYEFDLIKELIKRRKLTLKIKGRMRKENYFNNGIQKRKIIDKRNK